MLIDPPASSSGLVKNLQTQQQDTINSVARALNIKVGDTINATVAEVTNVNDTTKQRLVQLYLEKTTGLPIPVKSGSPTTNNPPTNNSSNYLTNTTANLNNIVSPTGQLAAKLLAQLASQTKTNIINSALSPQENLLLSNKLKLLQIDVKLPSVSTINNAQINSPKTQQLLIYTDHAINKKQQIQLQLKASGDLALLQPNKNPTANAAQKNKTASNPVLQQALRTALPQEFSNKPHIANTLQITLLLNQLTQKIGSFSIESSLPKTIQHALKTVATHLRSADQLAKPQVLKQAMQNSGVQFENRLKQVATSPLSNAPLNNTLQKNPAPTNVIQNTASQPTPTTANTLTQQDLKAALLLLLNKLQHTAPGAATQASSNQPNTVQPNALIAILQNLLTGNPHVSQLKQQLPREAMLQQLQHLVQQSLNKIQSQQLHSLSRKTVTPETQVGSTQSWQLEIPIRYGHDVHSMSLLLEEDWVQHYKDNHNSDEKEANKVRKWFVKLGFDLPGAGTIHAHLTIVENTVSANLWAEKPATFKKALEHIDVLKFRLQKDGVNITSIDCFAGHPPTTDNRLSYSLVDIKT